MVNNSSKCKTKKDNQCIQDEQKNNKRKMIKLRKGQKNVEIRLPRYKYERQEVKDLEGKTTYKFEATGEIEIEIRKIPAIFMVNDEGYIPVSNGDRLRKLAEIFDEKS